MTFEDIAMYHPEHVFKYLQLTSFIWKTIIGNSCTFIPKTNYYLLVQQ